MSNNGLHLSYKALIRGGAVLCVLALALFLLFRQPRQPADTGSVMPPPTGTASAGIAGYACPMMCTPPLPEPGKCPICGMEMMPIPLEGGGDTGVQANAPAAHDHRHPQSISDGGTAGEEDFFSDMAPDSGSNAEGAETGSDDLFADVDSPATAFVCPMHCTPPLDAPGKCPVCGMTLQPVRKPPLQSAESEPPAGGSGPTVTLSRAALDLGGIQTAPVQRRFVTARVRLYGRIDYDPAHMTVITAFMPGVIDRVYVKRAGQFVRWGDPLFDIYSSDLLQTQRQLIDAMKYVPSFLSFQGSMPHVARDMPVQQRVQEMADDHEMNEEVAEALQTIKGVRHKLSILGMPKRDIDELMKKGEATGIATVYASMYGQVTVHNAFEGTYVNTGAPIFTLADPKYMWLRLSAYEGDYAWIRIGQELTFETDVYPGEIFTATVVYVDPVFDPETRTFTIGAVSSDKGGTRLKAGMLARAVIHARLTREGAVAEADTPMDAAPLVIPSTAPLITGVRAVVYVRKPGSSGTFEGREIALGPKAEDSYIVRAGLKEGEEVVVNGNFKIDSTAQIYAKAGMMASPGGHLAAPYPPPGGSDGVAASYMEQRRQSRTGPRPRFHEAMEMDADERIRSRRPSAAGSVTRRRPGRYGDPTRHGGSPTLQPE